MVLPMATTLPMIRALEALAVRAQTRPVRDLRSIRRIMSGVRRRNAGRSERSCAINDAVDVARQGGAAAR